MRFDIDLRKPFDQVAFVEKREEVEKMLSNGWTPVWEPNLKIGQSEIEIPSVSSYFILVK